MCFKWFVVHNQNQPIVLMNNKKDFNYTLYKRAPF